jgi:hypothetical protein
VADRKVKPKLETHSEKKAPYFIEKPENKIIKEGTNDFVECVVDGHPFPSITWYKAGREVFEGLKYTYEVDQTTGVVGLSIKKAKAEDEAKYTIKIVNDSGEEQKTFSVFVKCNYVVDRWRVCKGLFF